MIMLNKDALIKKEDIKIEKLNLSDNEFIYIKEWTAQEQNDFELSLTEEVKDEKGRIKDYKRNLNDFRAKLAVSSVCDEKGNLLFKTNDYKLLSKNMSAKKLSKIADAIAMLNKIDEENIENLAKNSETVQKEDSISDCV